MSSAAISRLVTLGNIKKEIAQLQGWHGGGLPREESINVRFFPVYLRRIDGQSIKVTGHDKVGKLPGCFCLGLQESERYLKDRRQTVPPTPFRFVATSIVFLVFCSQCSLIPQAFSGLVTAKEKEDKPSFLKPLWVYEHLFHWHLFLEEDSKTVPPVSISQIKYSGSRKSIIRIAYSSSTQNPHWSQLFLSLINKFRLHL